MVRTRKIPAKPADRLLWPRCGYCGVKVPPGSVACLSHADLPMNDPNNPIFWRTLSTLIPTVPADTTEAPDDESPGARHVPAQEDPG